MTEIAQQIEKIERIQPLNPVMLDLLGAIQNPNSQASDLEKIINTDANTSATILKIANSPFYGMSGRINSVKDACVLLGVNQLKNIIYATAIDQAANKGPHKQWIQQMRTHTTACALIASVIATQPGVGLDKGQAYSLGLLHQLGKQVVLSELPDLFEALIHNDLSDVEKQASMSEAFSQAGLIIAKKWRLPSVFSDCVAGLRQPIDASSNNASEINLVQCAHKLAQALGFISTGEELEQNTQDIIAQHYSELESQHVLDLITEAISNHPDLASATQGS